MFHVHPDQPLQMAVSTPVRGGEWHYEFAKARPPPFPSPLPELPEPFTNQLLHNNNVMT